MTRTDGVRRRTDGIGPRGRAGAVLQRRLQLTCIAGACLFVFWQMRPDLLFSDTTPAGGDMAAHVWGPAFLRDHLLPAGRLSGWAPDWYAGFPAYHFYMVLPSLAIALASFVIPYGVAFKLVAVAGLVTLPLAAALFVRLAGLRFPAPAVAAVFTLPFLFDTSFSIYGGNVASTLAGEFSYSISLSLMLVYLGVVLRGLRTGRHRVLAGVLLALVGLTHLIPAIFATAATGVALAMQPGRRPLRWVAATGALGAGFAAFWLLPFWWRRAYYHNIDWVNLTEYWPNLVRDDWRWVLVGAWAGLLAGILRRRRLALYLAALAALAAATYRWIPQGVLWNARLLPFYYLAMLLLAAVGVATLLVTVTVGAPLSDLPTGEAEGPAARGEVRRRRWLPNDSLRLRIALAALAPVAAVAVAVDDLVAGSATLAALIEVVPGVEASTAPDRAADVAHLALIVLVAAAVVVLAELLRSLRAQGFRPKPSGLVVLGTPGPAQAAGGIRPAAATTRPAGVIRPLGAVRTSAGRGGLALSLGTAAAALVVVVAVAYPLRALGLAGHETPDGRYGLRVAPNVVVAGTAQKSYLPFWVYWNFSGYESKQPREGIGGYDEYYRVVTAMAAVA
ncbi:MAG: 6-pyruvoyl-tetrahydropterin synthase-related protein, partial [bacterium]|nr:6-pyruvoyl-tetrahydropterin synthase-related protein [bacterium]